MFLLRGIFILMILSMVFPGISTADRVIAVVNGQQIMESDLDDFASAIPEPFKKAFKKNALNKLIDSSVFYTLGVKEGFLNSEVYKKKMARAEQLIVSDLFIEKKLKPRITLTDNEIEEYYRRNQAKFKTGDQILPGHIVARNKDIAEALRQKINTDNFDVMAAGLSKNSEEARFFKLGWMEKGKSKMPSGFENVAFALGKGKISPVIQTEMGYHIIKIYDVKPGQDISFDQSKNNIKAQLTQEKMNRLKQDYLQSAKIEIMAKEYK